MSNPLIGLKPAELADALREAASQLDAVTAELSELHRQRDAWKEQSEFWQNKAEGYQRDTQELQLRLEDAHEAVASLNKRVRHYTQSRFNARNQCGWCGFYACRCEGN